MPIKKTCDLCGKETKKDYSEKFEDRNNNIAYYITQNKYGRGICMPSEVKDFIICNNCSSEKFSKKLDKIEDEIHEIIDEHTMKLWRKLRGIKKLQPIQNEEHYCVVCNVDLENKHCWGNSHCVINDDDAMCDDCQKFEEKVSREHINNPKFNKIVMKEVKKLIKLEKEIKNGN